MKEIPAEIKLIVEEMSVQGNHFPLYMVQEDLRLYVGYDGDWTHTERMRSDVVKEKYLCTKCKRFKAKDEELPKDCGKCKPEAFYHYKIMEFNNSRAGVFLTEKACQEHIDRSQYFYNNPRPCGVRIWRNPETQRVTKFLFEAAGISVPPHYL